MDLFNKAKEMLSGASEGGHGSNSDGSYNHGRKPDEINANRTEQESFGSGREQSSYSGGREQSSYRESSKDESWSEQYGSHGGYGFGKTGDVTIQDSDQNRGSEYRSEERSGLGSESTTGGGGYGFGKTGSVDMPSNEFVSRSSETGYERRGDDTGLDSRSGLGSGHERSETRDDYQQNIASGSGVSAGGYEQGRGDELSSGLEYENSRGQGSTALGGMSSGIGSEYPSGDGRILPGSSGYVSQAAPLGTSEYDQNRQEISQYSQTGAGSGLLEQEFGRGQGSGLGGQGSGFGGQGGRSGSDFVER